MTRKKPTSSDILRQGASGLFIDVCGLIFMV
jgi:hypothetical protein